MTKILQPLQPSPARSFQILPQAVPTSLTAVATQDAYLDLLVISVPLGIAVNITVQDAQGTPVAVLPAISPLPGTVSVIRFGDALSTGYYCPGGFSVQASVSGATFYAAWKQ